MVAERGWSTWRGGIDARLDGVDRRLDGIERRLERVEETVTDLGLKVASVARDMRWGGALILLTLAAHTGTDLIR